MHRVAHASLPLHQPPQALVEVLAVYRLRDSVRSHRLPSVQFVEACGKGSLVKQVHLWIEAFVPDSRRPPRYPLEVRVRRFPALGRPGTSPPKDTLAVPTKDGHLTKNQS